MLGLYNELILEIASHIKIEYIYDDDDPINNNLLIENGEWKYYPLRNLYLTCKAFKWLEDFEYTTVDSGEFHYDVCTYTIHGRIRFVINGNFKYVLGYANYDLHDYNTFYTDHYYFYRNINGLKYYESCQHIWQHCDECRSCIQLKELQKQLFKDQYLKNIFNLNHIDGTVFIRKYQFKNFTFQFSSDHLQLYQV